MGIVVYGANIARLERLDLFGEDFLTLRTGHGNSNLNGKNVPCILVGNPAFAREHLVCFPGFCDKTTPHEGGVIDRHQLLENSKVRFWIIGRGEKRGQHARFHQDQWLAAFPITAKRGQRLTSSSLSFLLSFGADFLRWEEAFDERRRILQRERTNLTGDSGGIMHWHHFSSLNRGSVGRSSGTCFFFLAAVLR